MQCIKTIFVVEIVSCFLDVFFNSPKFISVLHIHQTIPLFRSNYIFSSFYFCYVPATGQYTRGERKKTYVRDGDTKDTKIQKKYKKIDIISVKNVMILTADLPPNWWVATSDSTGQNSLKFGHYHFKSGLDRKRNQNWK